MTLQEQNKNNILMQDDNEVYDGEEITRLKREVAALSGELDLYKSEAQRSVELSDKANKLLEGSIGMLKNLEEVTSNTDFRTAMAVAEVRLGPYKGPWIQEAAKVLAIAVKEFSDFSERKNEVRRKTG